MFTKRFLQLWLSNYPNNTQSGHFHHRKKKLSAGLLNAFLTLYSFTFCKLKQIWNLTNNFLVSLNLIEEFTWFYFIHVICHFNDFFALMFKCFVQHVHVVLPHKFKPSQNFNLFIDLFRCAGIREFKITRRYPWQKMCEIWTLRIKAIL